MTPLVYVDFQNADRQGRLRLSCIGTTKDLAAQQVQLQKGLVLRLYSDDADVNGNPDDLLVDGVVEYSAEESCWVAKIDWDNIQHESDLRARVNPAATATPATLVLPTQPAAPIVSPTTPK